VISGGPAGSPALKYQVHRGVAYSDQDGAQFKQEERVWKESGRICRGMQVMVHGMTDRIRKPDPDLSYDAA